MPATELRTLAANIDRIRDRCFRGNLTCQSICSGITTRQVSAGISAGKVQSELTIASWNCSRLTAEAKDSEGAPHVAEDCGVVMPRRTAGAHPNPLGHECRTCQTKECRQNVYRSPHLGFRRGKTRNRHCDANSSWPTDKDETSQQCPTNVSDTDHTTSWKHKVTIQWTTTRCSVEVWGSRK
jgi:hypothetical protein